MAKVTAQGKTIECRPGENLRQLLLKHNIDLYNGNAKLINCHGIGTCGTCAVEVEGEVSPQQWQEKTRLSFSPHSPTSNRRLACQTQVLGDVNIKKYDGFWGQGDQLVWSAEE